MTIYILLIVYVLALYVFSAAVMADRTHRETFILRMGMLAIFLLLALKKETVGIDIVGYREQYDLSAIVAWQDTNYVYFEPGYIQLMKVFSKAGLDFQVFAACIYAVCCGAYYRFARRYSRNMTLSLLIFICYQFLVFYTSGLRQALAMAICIYGFLVLDGKWAGLRTRTAGCVLLVLAASLIHKSALLFLVVAVCYSWMRQRVFWRIMILAFGGAVLVRSVLLRILAYLFDLRQTGQITLGGNFLFLAGLAVFCAFACYQKIGNEQEDAVRYLTLATNMTMLSVVLQILFSGSSLLRSTMYLTLFLIPGLPCALKRYDRRIEFVMTGLLGLFLIWLFWAETLSVNQLNLCPYRFFWE